MNFQAIHFFVAMCGVLAAGLPQLESAFPAAASPYLKGAAAVLALLGAVLGVLSPSAKLPKDGDA